MSNHLFTEPNCEHNKAWNTCVICNHPTRDSSIMNNTDDKKERDI